jgi:hypothetical protein
MYFKSVELSKIAVLSALYVVCSYIPISLFLGASSFLSLAIVIVPIISVILRPREAFFASLIGGMIIIMINPGANMFGILTILLPTTGATAGSLLFYYGKKGGLITIGICATSILYYLSQRIEFPFWILPHVLSILMVFLTFFFKRINSNFFIFSFIATICEQSMMLILAVGFLNLPVFVFQSAFVLMLYERLFASMGGGFVLFIVNKNIPNLIVRGNIQ